MTLDSLVAFFIVVECQFLQVLRLDETRQTFARVNVLVDLHEDFMRLCDDSASEVRIHFAVLKRRRSIVITNLLWLRLILEKNFF